MDLLSLAQQHLELTREGAFAYRAVCPRCQHEDGFVIARDTKRGGWRYWLNCCGDRRGGDAHDLAKLLGKERPSFSPQDSQIKMPEKPQFDARHWRRVLYGTQRNLTPDSEAGAYLLARGLLPETWQRFGLGAGHRAGQPALFIPWFVGGHLWGGRYRILSPTDKHTRYAWWKGSNCRNRLFGGHTHQERRVLIVCEGEINAMSIYQAAGGAVDTLSTGSENATAPTSARWTLPWAEVFCWFDKPERAEAWATALYGRPVSLNGIDANDLLVAGELSAALLCLSIELSK